MGLRRIVSKSLGCIRRFKFANSGNIGVMTALLAVPLVGGAGIAVDTTRAVSTRTAVQTSLDSSALNLMRQAPTLSKVDLTAAAKSMFLANFDRPEALNIQVTANYDSTAKSLTLTGQADVPTAFMSMAGFNKVTVNGTATSTLGGSKRYPVCVMITDPTQGHTFLVKNNAQVNFTSCLTQVNTQNWDAVEARDTSYIHSTNGVNCFVGDIHYGDVTPPKQDSCEILPDPFAGYTVPTNTCDFTKKVVNTTSTLSPGTYCGLTIKGSANVTFSPGVYYIQGGDLIIQDTVNVTATGVTFVLSGKDTNVKIITSGTVTMSPNLNAAAGQWAGFQFYYKPFSASTNNTSTFSAGTIKMSGVMYLAGQTLEITKKAKVTVDPGAIVAAYLLPDDASLTLSSTIDPTNPALFSKKIANSSPILVK